jgi:predicted amidohydrolase
VDESFGAKMIRRRTLLLGTVAGTVAVSFGARGAAAPRRFGLLHLAPAPGDVAGNRRLIERGVESAAANGADWIVTPELAVSGYTFQERIGTDWIDPQPDAWTRALSKRVAALGVTLFLAQPERDAATGVLHNAVFVIGASGAVLGVHRKILTLPVGAEAWSKPGGSAEAIAVPGGRIGVMICADAYDATIARRLREQGAEILVSSAAWATGLHGPDGEWERCSADTGVPVVVCNRTGVDGAMDFRGAHSVVAIGGERVVTQAFASSTLLLVDWDERANRPAGTRAMTL